MGNDHPEVNATDRRVRDRRLVKLPFDGPDRRASERRSGHDRRRSVREENVRFVPEDSELLNERDPAPTERRRSTRKSLETTVSIRDAKGVLAEGCVFDLSLSGCQVTMKSGRNLEAGRTYSLRLGGLNLDTGCVVWSAYGRFGIEFLKPLYAPVVEDLVQRFPAMRAFPESGRLIKRPPIQLIE